MNGTKLDAALDLARRGFAVFPLTPNAKTPAISNWQNLATTDPAQIQAWWRAAPDGNVAIPTATLLVVDIDPRNGGDETFQQLVLLDEFPKTARTRTQGGGSHAVYALPSHVIVKGGANKLGPGVDIKSWGGYVVAPGSTIDGRPYAWANDRPIAPAPQWLIERCNAVRPRSEAAGKRIVEEDDTAVALAEAWLKNHAPDARLGDLKDTAFKVAARLYDFGVSPTTCAMLLTEWSETHAYPRLEPETIATTVASAARNRDNATGCLHPAAAKFEAPENADEIMRGSMTSEPPTTATDKFRSIPAAAGAKLALERRGRFLIKGLLDCGGMSVLYGESGGGKTFMGEDIAYHVGKGAPWYGHKTRQGAVVYLAAEGGSGTYARLAALEAHYGSLADVWMHVIPVPADFIHGGGDVKALIAEIKRIEAEYGHKVELVVVDTLSRAMAGGDENSSVDMGVMVKALDFLRLQAAAHVMVVHHTGKDKAKGARGHSLLRAATDTEIEIDNKTLTVTKQRDMDGCLTLPFKLVPIRIGTDEDGDPVTSCYVELRIKEEFPAEPQPLTGESKQFADALRTWLRGQYDKKEEPDELPFKTRDAIICASNLTPQNARVHSENPRAFTTMVGRLMSEMHDNAHIRQVSKGKWFFRNAQNAQNAQISPDSECTDAQGSRTLCIPSVTASTGERKKI